MRSCLLRWIRLRSKGCSKFVGRQRMAVAGFILDSAWATPDLVRFLGLLARRNFFKHLVGESCAHRTARIVNPALGERQVAAAGALCSLSWRSAAFFWAGVSFDRSTPGNSVAFLAFARRTCPVSSNVSIFASTGRVSGREFPCHREPGRAGRRVFEPRALQYPPGTKSVGL